jgi:hypothetical protein
MVAYFLDIEHCFARYLTSGHKLLNVRSGARQRQPNDNYMPFAHQVPGTRLAAPGRGMLRLR